MFIQKWHHFNVSIFRELRSIRLKRHLECLHSLCQRIVMVQKYHPEISWTHLLHHNTTTLYHHNKIYIYNSFHAKCTPATHGNSMLHLRAHGTGPWRALQYWIELHKKNTTLHCFWTALQGPSLHSFHSIWCWIAMHASEHCTAQMH